MGVISNPISLAATAKPEDVFDELSLSARWREARRAGLVNVEVLFDPNNPSSGLIRSSWDSPESAKAFSATLKDDAKSFKLAGKPQLMVNARRLKK